MNRPQRDVSFDVEALYGRRNDDRWNRMAVGDILERMTWSEPDKIAVVADPSAVADPRYASVTYREADATANRMANVLPFDPAEGRRTARLLIRLAEAIRGTGKPVIAKIRGWCVGGGNELNLLCDFAIAAESARFAHTDPQLGNAPIWFGTQLLPHLVGTRRAKEILMLGGRYTATEAAAMGWINRAVPDAELDGVVAEWCAKLLEQLSPERWVRRPPAVGARRTR